MLRRAFELAAERMGREPRPGRVRPGGRTGEAGRQAAKIAQEVFSAFPDIALDRWIEIIRPVTWTLVMRRVGGTREYEIEVKDDHLYEKEVEAVRAAAHAIMVDAMRARAMAQDEGGFDPGVVPLWAVTASRPMVDLMRRMSIDVNGATSEALAQRLTRVFAFVGGEATLSIDATTGRLTGVARAPWEIDRPFIRVTDAPGEANLIEIIKAPTMPLTVMAQMESRRLGEIVDLGPLSADMPIVKATQDNRGLKLMVDGPPTTVREAPAGIDMRWVALST